MGSQVDDHGDQCSQLRDETNVSDEYLGGNSKESNRESSQIEPKGNLKRSKGQNKETWGKSKIRSTNLMKRTREVSSGHRKGQNKETWEVSKLRSTKPKKLTKEVSSDKMFEHLCVWFVLFIAGIGLYFYSYISKTDTINHPLKIPKVNSKLTTSAKRNSKYFWGSYRANLYFGLKTRSPRSPVVGLMWMKQFPDPRKQGSNKLRHWCKEDDELVKYGWLRHDGLSFGIHEVEEEEFIFNTTFVKRQVGHHGGEWSARITAFSTNQKNAPVVSFFTYTALDKHGNLSYFKNNGEPAIVGSSEELGDFHISFKISTDSRIIVHDSFEGHVSGLDVLDETLSKHFVPKPLVENKVYNALKGTNETDRGINFVVHQITAELPLKFDIIFKSNSFRSENILQGDKLTREIEKRSGEFDKKFSSVFDLESKRYTLKAINFAKATLSNMLGSISYFHGSSQKDGYPENRYLERKQKLKFHLNLLCKETTLQTHLLFF
ncbi:mannosyl-oligosaccharide glucosidase-like [Saccostrea cucullata]|uniref:mannosyl-oligosaccharide glucosidase-like n=1 Tax=Saccostrea cuccullata TaxID=36930 RepID=UPI002ED0E7FD